jgi:Xaa-Pro aminopeptidase
MANQARLSVQERDRRYEAIRDQLRDRGADCAIVGATNLLYLTNGIAGERHGLLPTEDLPPTVALHDRNFVDLTDDARAEITSWVEDLRPGNDARPLIERIRELRLERGTIGITDMGIGFGGFSHGIYAELQAAFPEVKFIDVTDAFTNVRALKSNEEIAMLEQADDVFQAGIDAVCEMVRPGMLGARAVHEAIRGMWDAGGDLDAMIGFSCWPLPQRNHVLQHLTMSRRIEPGDAGIITGFAKAANYTGHGDQTVFFGQLSPLHEEMFRALEAVRTAILQEVRHGAENAQLTDAYKKACLETGFRVSTQSQIHQYGIEHHEHPGAAFRLGSGGRDDFMLHAGMVYSICPAITAPDGEDIAIGGASVVVTMTGYRDLGAQRLQPLVIEG